MAYFLTVCIVFSVYKQNLWLNNLKNRTTGNAKISVLVICVEVIIYLLLHNLHDCNFNKILISSKKTSGKDASLLSWSFKGIAQFFWKLELFKYKIRLLSLITEILQFQNQKIKWNSQIINYQLITGYTFFLNDITSKYLNKFGI